MLDDETPDRSHVWPGGRRPAFISGGDGPDGGADAEPEGGEAEPEGSLLDTEPDPDDRYFDKEYVTKLRGEAADYRTKYAPFRDAFDGFNDQEREYLLGMVGTLGKDLKGGAVQLRDLAAGILEDEFLAGTKWEQQIASIGKDPDPEGDEFDPEAPLTMAQFQQMLEEMQQSQASEAEEASIQEVMYEANELGFKPGSEEYGTLLHFAINKFEGDLEAAAEFVRPLYGMEPATEADPEGNEPKFPSTSGKGRTGSVTPSGDDPTGWEAARDRAERRLGAQLGS